MDQLSWPLTHVRGSGQMPLQSGAIEYSIAPLFCSFATQSIRHNVLVRVFPLFLQPQRNFCNFAALTLKSVNTHEKKRPKLTHNLHEGL
jgi:hypothetical protein